MERCSYGFYTKRTEPEDSAQKKKDPEKEPRSPSYQQLSKPADKQPNDNQNIVQVGQHVPAQQLLSPTHSSSQPLSSKEDPKDKNLLKVANSTTITLIDNGTLIGEKDKDYPKNYFTLEPKIDKKDDNNKNSITITKTVPKQSPSSQADKTKGQAKSAKRPLQYLETLAEKAGITFDDKYEAANTLLALDKQNNVNRRPPELKQPKTEPENHNQADEYNRYRSQKEEDDKLQIQQQIIQQQQQQQQLQQLQQLQQQQLQHQQLQQQALQRQHQQVLQQHLKNQQDQQELLQKQFQQQQQQQQQQQKPELLQVAQSTDGQQKFLQPLHTQQFNVPGIGEINLSFLASPQNNVNLVFDKNQKPGMSTEIKPQQIDGQTQVVQQQMNMSQQESTQHHHQTVTVVSSMPNSMAHQVQQPQQAGSAIQQQAGQLPSMPPLHSLPQNTQQPQQISSEWGHSRVQVIQQPLPSNAYLQQLYNTQGPLIMPGNIALHPGITSQQIQVIAAGKPFQGSQLAPHMITQGKQVLQGQAASFPGYTTIPTTQNQTFVFSPLSVINSQSSILPTHSQSTVSGIGQQKQGDMHKCGSKVTGGKVGNTSAGGQTLQAQCVQVSQPVLGTQQPTQTQIISPLQANGQPMQFAPWQISGALPQVWTGGLQAGTLPAGGLLAPNPTLFIRGSQPDQHSMFIQHSPQNNLQQNTSIACSTATTAKPRASAEGMSKGMRPLSNILPSGGIRPAASVSTQTNQGQSAQGKLRGKPGVRPPATAAKQDAANQTNKIQHQMQQPKQQLLVMNPNGQMTQITSMQDKQALSKNMQQQAIMQQQIQQQQQQQLLHQQQQNQQMVQHYQQQGMQMMQQSGLPVGSVAQTMTGMPQTISMVQQIHPLSGMSQQSNLVGQLNAQSQNPITQVQALQQQQQTLVGTGMVQTSVGMAVQQQGMSHSAPMQTLTLQAPGTVGLIATPVQGSVLPMPQTALITHVKTEDEKMPPPPAPIVQPIAPHVVTAEGEVAPPAPVFSSANTATVTASISAAVVSATIATDTASSTTHGTRSGSRISPLKVTTAEAGPSVSTPVPSGGQQTTPVTPQVVTTAASSTSVPTANSAGAAAPPPSPGGIFKGSQSTARNISQTTTHDKGLPKAMVKPNILTHVIEGYVIQEAAEPFAVNRPLREWGTSNAATAAAAAAAASAVPSERIDRESREARETRDTPRERRDTREGNEKENKCTVSTNEEPPRKKQMLASSSTSRITSSSRDEPEAQAGPSKSCRSQPVEEPEEQDEESIAQTWSVSEVCEFIRAIPGCANYADDFLMQEVDGEALLLIKPEHLVMALSMKLGPALKIVACINALRPDIEQAENDNE